jgi:C2 domain
MARCMCCVLVRHVGLVRLLVIKGRDLKKADLLGKSDPFVEAYTTAEQVEKTSVKKRTLEPEWKETLFLLAQEPATQNLRVELYDWDAVHLSVGRADGQTWQTERWTRRAGLGCPFTFSGAGRQTDLADGRSTSQSD